MSFPVERMLNVTSAPLRQLGGVRILATGSYAPEQIVTNADLASLGCDPDWIVQRTGVHERRRAPPEIATSDLAVSAAQRCLASANCPPGDVDLVIVATFTPDFPAPATACLVQDRLGINAPAFDLNAACAGFFYALVTGMQFVSSGCARRALVIGADTNTRVVDPRDPKIYPIFGDGAGAVLLAPGEPDQGFLAYTLGADGSGVDLLRMPMGGTREPPHVPGVESGRHYLWMEGRPVFKWAVRIIPQSTREVLAAAQVTLDQVRGVILHQANARIIDAVAAELEIPPQKVWRNIERYGNTSAGSIPLVLDEHVRAGELRRGDLLLISGFGAGLAWGTGLLRW
ncbi:MAG: beta-ketoacyl-ACP synthase III [Pirellulales bacterium]|nr:beta-ketoacyl-ACP synthase III [Pirellulales bacterium]